MMIVLYTVSALAALIAIASAAILWAQAAGRVQTVLRIQALAIDAAHKSAALAYFDWCAGQVSLARTIWDHLRAPFVLLLPLLRLPWAADDLPGTLAYWRNDVSINGDGWGWKDADGNWHQCSVEPTPPSITAVPYTDPAYGGDAYYAPGHHPRSWWARWIWLAFRNVASKRMLIGPVVSERPILLARANPATSGGYSLLWNGVTGPGAAYEWCSTGDWGPIPMWTHVGAKLGTPYTYPEVMPCPVPVTCTWRAFSSKGF